MPDKKNTQKNLLPVSIALVILIILLIIFFGIKFFNSSEQAGENNSNENKDITALEEMNIQTINNATKILAKRVDDINENDHFLGTTSSPIQIIVYSDFECPYCANYSKILKQVKDYFNDQVVIAFRHYPLRMHTNAFQAALASECAAEQGKFWEMYEALYQANEDDALNEEQYKSAAENINLEMDKFNLCYSTEKYKDKIQSQWLDGLNYGVSGTPGSFVNGEPVPGAVPFEDFVDSQGYEREGMKTIIERHLNQG